VVDPEGDYGALRDAVVLGDAKQEPRIKEAIALLAKPEASVSINLLAIDPHERPRFLAKLLPELAKMRAETGRPHWIVVDEIHHCLPAKWEAAPITLPRELPAAIGVTVHPDEVSPDFLSLVSTVVGVGEGAPGAVEKFCRSTQRNIPDHLSAPERGQVIVLDYSGVAKLLTATAPKEKQQRHVRKYAHGELGEDKSFYFRGPAGALNLRAHNLTTFLQLAAGVDEGTWLHHLHEGAYSRWFREAIKDEELAAEAEPVEADTTLSAAESRERIKEFVDKRYTAPAKTSGQ
jgi:hypothetical protein